MDFPQRFDELADAVYAAGSDPGDRHRSDTAVDVFQRRPDLVKFDPAACLEWLVNSRDLPAQTWDNDFGQPAVTVAQRPGFRLDVLYWTQNATTTHKHVSCGAFAAVGGKRIHSVYDFVVEQAVGDHVWSGQLNRTRTHVMRSGDAHPILPGLIHDIYWVDTPSVTLAVRCDDHPGRDQERPLEYWQPGLAFLDRVHQKDATISKQVEALRLTAAASNKRHRSMLERVLSEGSALLAYHAFRDALILRPNLDASKLLTGLRREDDLLGLLRSAAEHIRRKATFESMYCGDAEAQTLAAILWSGASGAELGGLLADAFPDMAPAEAIDTLGKRLFALSAEAAPYVVAARRGLQDEQ